MVGNENAATHGGSEQQAPSPETTTIGIPALAPAAVVDPKLSPEEQAAVTALPSSSALLIAHSGPNAGARFLLDQDLTTAGRHPNADIFLDDVTVSRKHAQFERVEGGFTVSDTRSLNGTYVNNDRVDNVVLRNGNEIQIGKFRLTFYSAQTAATQQPPVPPLGQE
ncbi:MULTISPECIES: FHA domain-containing protein [unclassified Arthrobacter]|uniref:FHA domain-containing protein n=1 Tax=unclassified Arthrobacter TaxID=235627 RepID=UPI001490EBDD|nr:MULTISPECIES: FHA domain-containing protein [unclassified Arthrobacter]MBE0009899.1 FHA domain-containing protein [Arthrobacter sp. AET 35A]NOJ59850.1 FHA domain-containing protein [Arthrobacter sp. 260]NOJ63761.1 FHA domain-containing protein [Arthrobacter sp. 147(2020)]